MGTPKAPSRFLGVRGPSSPTAPLSPLRCRGWKTWVGTRSGRGPADPFPHGLRLPGSLIQLRVTSSRAASQPAPKRLTISRGILIRLNLLSCFGALGLHLSCGPKSLPAVGSRSPLVVMGWGWGAHGDPLQHAGHGALWCWGVRTKGSVWAPRGGTIGDRAWGPPLVPPKGHGDGLGHRVPSTQHRLRTGTVPPRPPSPPPRPPSSGVSAAASYCSRK